jgi:hypothetical protein
MSGKLIVASAVAMTLVAATTSMGGKCVAAPDTMAANAATRAEVAYKGTVMETMNASRYTYARIDTGKEKIWVAGPVAEIKVGDLVSVGTGILNKEFHSKTLNRTFDEIRFVDAIMTGGDTCGNTGAVATVKGLPEGHPAIGGMGMPGAAADPVVVGMIEKAEGGKTVAEVWAGKVDLSGKKVVVRGKVVKANTSILGRNWYHLRDGSGTDKGDNDLVVTSKDMAKVGDVVTASGVVGLGKDFGAGYKYELIMEEASLMVK